MKIYSMNVRAINPSDEKWYRHLSEKRIEKVNRLKKDIHKSQSIGAELLLRRALCEKGTVKWDTDENGKLYLTERGDIYVNLSHSGDYAVCAVNDKPVGVDIQKCRKCDIKIADRFFTEKETEYIKNSVDMDDAFFEVWTKKESFVKAVGAGLSMPLNSFSVQGDEITYEGKTYRFTQHRVKDDGYKLFSCCLL